AGDAARRVEELSWARGLRRRRALKLADSLGLPGSDDTERFAALGLWIGLINPDRWQPRTALARVALARVARFVMLGTEVFDDGRADLAAVHDLWRLTEVIR